MFGLGGIYVEVLKDVVFRIVPIDEQEATNMVESIKTIKSAKGCKRRKIVRFKSNSRFTTATLSACCRLSRDKGI